MIAEYTSTIVGDIPLCERFPQVALQNVVLLGVAHSAHSHFIGLSRK